MRPRPKRPRARDPRVRFLLVWVLLGSTGCAYFNTFYHAKRFYNQAENIRKDAEIKGQSNNASEIYKKSIDKCQKVIENYPGSKWQDDAHLLLAKGYYGRGDYLNAERTLKKFDERFTDSDLYPEAIYWLGLTAYAGEDYQEARRVWGRLLEEFPKTKFREKARFYVAEALWKDREPEPAAAAFQRFLEDYPGSDLAASARIDLGKLFLEQDRNEEAAAAFDQAARKGKQEEDRLEARMLYGEALEAQNKPEEALNVYSELSLALDPNVIKGRMSAEEREALRVEELALAKAALEDSLIAQTIQNPGEVPGQNTAQDPTQNPQNPQNASYQNQLDTSAFTQSNNNNTNTNNNRTTRNVNNPQDRRLAQSLLREGTVLGKLGRPWDAILVFEQVVSEYPRTPFSAEAQYRIGYTYEVLLEDFDEAQTAYTDVSRQGVSSFREEAARRAKNLTTVKSLLAAAATDSLSQARAASAEARFMRAELFLFQQEDSDRALSEYRAIENEYAGTEHAAKAGLAIAWVLGHSLDDSTSAMAKYTEVAETFPATEYGRRASAVVHGPERDPDAWEYAGPTMDQLRDPENLALLAAGLEAQRLQALSDTAGTPVPSPVVARPVPVRSEGSEGQTPSPGFTVPPGAEGMSLGDLVSSTKTGTPQETAAPTEIAADAPPDSTAQKSFSVTAKPVTGTPGTGKPVIVRQDPPQRLTEIQPQLEESPGPAPETGEPTRNPADGETATVSAVTPKMSPPIPAPEPFFWEEEEDGVNPLRAVNEAAENTEATSGTPAVETKAPPLPGMADRRWLYLDPLAIPEGGPTPVDFGQLDPGSETPAPTGDEKPKAADSKKSTEKNSETKTADPDSTQGKDGS